MYDVSEKSYTRQHLLADLQAGFSPLEAAKRKWTAIINGGEDFGTYSCACCETYFDKDNPRACLLVCPLGGTEGCCNGDYSRWVRHQNSEHMHEHTFYAIHCPECEDIALGILAIIETRLQNRYMGAG
ncbi:MAG TPA: hypothetical protein VGK02_02940 [Candidatus Aquicultor sp.]